MASETDNPRDLADISRLADGTLEPSRRDEVKARIDASPELRALYERERSVVALLHEAAATDRAPARLRAAIEASRPSRPAQVRRRFAYGGALAGALACVALALILILPGGTPGSPSLSQAAALAFRGAAAPPPTPNPHAPSVKLGRNVQEVYFPNWQPRFGWRATGQRTDAIGDRRAVTVYYALHGLKLAYTIVSAPALEQPSASVNYVGGTELRALTLGGRVVVTWRRSGHTCVLSGTGVTAASMEKLASWRVPGEIR